MVELKRAHPPAGSDPKVTVSEVDLKELLPVTGDPTVAHADLVQLADVNMGAVLHNLRLRYEQEEMFTAVGPILIATNPYKSLPSCDAEYMSSLTQESNHEKLPPHTFKIAHAAYTKMMQTLGAQSVLISGESGAGKTETTKLCMGCLAEISGSSGASTEAALESGVLLEAFGNAKTVHNNNSSRFGKWCAVHFNEKGSISACRVLSYLLEKSRVVGPGENERNYHFFYQLLAGASDEQRASLRLLEGAAEYLYLQGPSAVEGIDDKEEWGRTCDKLSSLGFTEAQQGEMFKICSAVLLLGNLAFSGSGKEGETLSITTKEPLTQAAELLQVGVEQLQTSLVTRKVSSGRGSTFVKPLEEQQCLDTRDALAKAIYTALFEWVVSRLNAFMSAEAGAPIDEEEELFVGLLDVFGFENFEFNSFEQLCINYTNEKLQQQFINALVVLQQQDYAREGLKSIEISFPDNSEQLNLLDAKLGVMGLLDEECALPKGSEEAYVDKMHKFFAQTPYYDKPACGGVKVKRRSVLASATPAPSGKDLDRLQFSVVHYAGKVTYTAEAWLDKNRGFLQPELQFLMRTSSSSLLPSLFTRDGGGGGGGGGGTARDSSKDLKKSSTVLGTFRASLRSLSATLLQTNARYIRCIKPNALKEAGRFDGHFISRQLRYTGVSAVVEIQRSGYPISLPKAEFVKRYKSCAFSEPAAVDASLPIDTVCTNLLDLLRALLGYEEGASWLEMLEVQLGKTKIFLREDVVRMIEKAREAIWEEAAQSAQRVGRGLVARKQARLMQVHAKATKEVRQALDGTPPQVILAAAGLAVLKKHWDEAGALSGAGESLNLKRRELAELTHEVAAFERGLQEEVKALEELSAALEGGEFVALKVALQCAVEAAPRGLSGELAGAMEKARGVLEAEAKRVADEGRAAADEAAKTAARAQAEELKSKEAEVARLAAERQKKAAEAQAAQQAAGGGLGAGELARVEVVVRNDPRPEKGVGLEINPMNTVIALVRGGLAVMDERLFVGDIIIAVDGIDVRGKKAVSAMDEKATQYTFTVLRSPDVVVGGGSGGGGGGGASADGGASGGGRGDAGGGASGPDMDGWLTKVKAQDGRALKMPEKRWVVLQGSTLHWYKDSKCEMLANSQHIGSCELTMPRKGADAADLQNQAMAAFAKLRKYPFMLSWPNKEVKHDLVFAASTSADRAAWAQALRDAIQRAKVSAPSAGWLCKEGGRRTGLSLSSWKRRWFVLNQGSSELRYFESPSSTTYKGVIPLHNSDVFVPKQVKGLKSQYSINLCIASERPVAKGKETHMCTLLAAATHEERDSWLKSLTDACKRGGEQRKAAPASAAAAASGGAPPTAAQAGPRVDVGAGAMEQGNAVNLEQIILLEVDVLLTLRIKQLKDVLRHMGVDFSNAVEKKDLVALVVKHREGRK